jgi:hypothetical protein
VSYFTTNELHVVQVDADEWRITKGFSFVWTGRKITAHVEEDFITDFASVPRPFRWLIPKSGEYNMATVVHDRLCQTPNYPRKQADAVFLEALRVLRVARWKRVVLYLGVRAYWEVIGKIKARKELENGF